MAPVLKGVEVDFRHGGMQELDWHSPRDSFSTWLCFLLCWFQCLVGIFRLGD